jgi:hypothetical protein
MSEFHAIAERYLAMWNEPQPDRRRALVAAGWAADGRYADPLMTGRGHEGIAAMIEGARASFPGHGFTLRGTPDGHGSFVRFAWTLASADGSPVAGGTDVARLDGAGRFVEVTGFLDGAASNE